MSKFILTDGVKATNLLTSDDPTVWTGLGIRAQSDDITLYSRVAAAFRAYNLKANTVASMPFVLYKGDTEFDNSATWQNNVKFLHNPAELLRLNTLSYIAKNEVYIVRTSDALGYKTRGLHHAVPFTFTPWLSAAGTAVDYIERNMGTLIERYDPQTGKRIDGGKGEIVYFWRMDQTTEILPSPNTEARAIANAAGVAFFADTWIKHFFERGGIPPTVIAIKGAVNPNKTSDEEQSWSDWLLGMGARFGNRIRSRIARVFNADTLDVKQFGSSVTELKDNKVYEQALANIAMGTGMPLSLLLSNSANYATAQIELKRWYDSDIIPFCQWLAYEYNRWIYEPIGLRMEFQPQTLDPQQEDETQRAVAVNSYADSYSKFPTYGLWRGTMDMLGAEIPDALDKAAQEYYAEKKQPAEIVAQQTQKEPVEVEDTEEAINEEPIEKVEEEQPTKFIPSLDQMRELQRWQELAFRKHKRGEPTPLDWRNDTLPDEVYKSIVAQLATATDEAGIKAAFDFGALPATPIVNDDIKELAQALNKLADNWANQPQPVST